MSVVLDDRVGGGMPMQLSMSSIMEVPPDRLIAALEHKQPNILVACIDRLRSLLFKAESYQTQILRGVHVDKHPKQFKGQEQPPPSTLIELPLPPSATQTLKKGCSTLQRSVLPMRLSDQATALHMRLVQLKCAVSEGRLDVKAFGIKSDHDTNPAHVAALLRVCLALMGKQSFDDMVEHWMLVPRQRLISLYIDEYSATMQEIIRIANEQANEEPTGPQSKYAQLEPQTYQAPTSRERIGEKILQRLNVVVVPMVDKQADPLGPGQIMQGVMSNPVGMPGDYLVRHIDMLFRNMAMTEREHAGSLLTGDRETWELLRCTLPKDALPMVEGLVCTYGGEEERLRLGITARRRSNALARIASVKTELDTLAKSAEAHVATCKSKNVEAAREHHIRGKARQLGVWLDPAKRSSAEMRSRYHEKHMHELTDGDDDRRDAWDPDDDADHVPPPPDPNRPRPLGTQQGCGLSLARDGSLQSLEGGAMPGGQAGVVDPDDGVQLSVKINDPGSNGGTRYKAWVFHRDDVLKRLGWRLLHCGQDYATFLVPQACLAPADRERRNKIPKEERQYWSDKNDFCRCLEVVLDEVSGKPPAKPHKGIDVMDKHAKRKRLQEEKDNRYRKKMHQMVNALLPEVAPVPPPGIRGGDAGPLAVNSWQMQVQRVHGEDPECVDG
uniref:Uncharacterized protein n=1 Tax=Guillardia theta TaxID=55529 RepID=A0A7S4KVJ9_GUITH|mmetsp:Transcript_32031/g.102046  ORF Transcript_32031/g.102046 Transcript_32031/m.102046 type:complete len:669 (+) Transcript_32031:82-2088(+)